MPKRPGALVCSLDFELLWGVRDHLGADGGAYRPALLGARRAVPAMLRAFEAHRVHATWATVGFLFARTREEFHAHLPARRPAYVDPRLSPYQDAVGAGERDDPIRFGASLVERIRDTPGQEVGTHTFSHFYCLEPGATLEAFEADLDAAVRIAALRGVRLRSIVFPRNQVREGWLQAVRARGLVALRGNPLGWAYRPAPGSVANHALRRSVRLADLYVPAGSRPTAWSELARPDGLCDVRATFFLRPAGANPMEGLRLRRIASTLRSAAQTGRVVHLWWHPHNFGRNAEASLAFLEHILRVFDECRDRQGMESLSMVEAAERALGESPRRAERHG